MQMKIGIAFGKSKTVKAEWIEYKKAIFKGQTPNRIQIEETEKAFYAGFYSCLGVCFELADLNEEQGAEALENFKIEVEKFFEQCLQEYRARKLQCQECKSKNIAYIRNTPTAVTLQCRDCFATWDSIAKAAWELRTRQIKKEINES